MAAHAEASPDPGGPAARRGRALRTPRAAAVAGIVFSILLIATLTMLNLSVPKDVAEFRTWIREPAHRRSLAFALQLVPFAGIAFLWFIGVVRDRIGQHEDRFFATVFLGSGVLFVAMLFAAGAVAGGLIAVAASPTPPLPDALISSRNITALLLHVYAMRMAAVFTIATANITLRTGVIPRWIAVAGFVVGVVLLVSVGLSRWVELLFPAWILLLSADILLRSFRPREEAR